MLEALADPTVLMTAFSFGCDRAQLRCPENPPAGLALMEWTWVVEVDVQRMVWPALRAHMSMPCMWASGKIAAFGAQG